MVSTEREPCRLLTGVKRETFSDLTRLTRHHVGGGETAGFLREHPLTS